MNQPADVSNVSTLERLCRGLSLAVIAIALTACVYRIDVSQGNLLEEDDVELVTVGMQRSQVQFLLGTPMINDIFHRERWDYPYYLVRGRSKDVYKRWVIVYFEDDVVTRIDRDVELNPIPPS